MISRKELEALWWRSQADRRRARPDLAEQQDRNGHGVRSTYAYWFCRCDRCKAANMRYTKQMRLARARAEKGKP